MEGKIAFVVQRYGLEVNGGSEYHCRLIAELLSHNYQVDVLTTKAIDYMTWENFYENEVEYINNVTVRRFPTDFPRNVKEFNEYSQYIFGNPKRTFYEEMEWMKKQGPVSFELLDYIKNNHHEYKLFVFFTYTYFTTFIGMQLVPEKSILVPTAHDEPHIYLSIYKSFFHLPRHIMFNTLEEREFIHQQFNNGYIGSDIVGVGVNIPNEHLTEEQFRKKFNINDPYIIYVGRIDESKGCKELFEYYLRYTKENQSNLKLVLMGKPVMTVPKHPDIISLGFVSEEEKYGGISGAKFLIMPSKYESLSMVVLESLALKRPVLVNGECEVLKGHCERGNAGLYYSNYSEFQHCINTLKNKNINYVLGNNGKEYVDITYNWSTIAQKFISLIENF
jgi:glycosyltransferase involved in cell wall biosynthesis